MPRYYDDFPRPAVGGESHVSPCSSTRRSPGPLPALDVEAAALRILTAMVGAGHLESAKSYQAVVRNALDLAAEFVAACQWRRMQVQERDCERDRDRDEHE